jgi:L-ribulokinase
MSKYVLGSDFGTESVRSSLIDIDIGDEICSSVYEYKNGVIDKHLPESNIKLPIDTALQDPEDYEDGIIYTINNLLDETKVNKSDIIGLGIDFTSCTMLPIKADSTPLCFIEKFRSDPNSWVKLWKHHAANKYTLRLNEIAIKRGEEFLNRYGEKISPEWMIPKIMQIAEESPEIYNEADYIIECGDWVVQRLTGNLTRNISCLGYKAIWDGNFPSREFFKELSPKLENIYYKLSGKVLKLGELAGYLSSNYQRKLGLPRLPIAASNIDAHVAVPATTVVEPGKMVMVMGTSTCHMVLWDRFIKVTGVGGIVRDGIISGFYGYEAGQASVGDVFEWFMRNSVPHTYFKEAKNKNIPIFDYPTKLASRLKPGESGILCLDWFNGNRSILMDAELSGLILGIKLSTRPEEIYRAIIEATAFGTRKIIESFEKSGIKIDSLFACGGLAQKNKMLIQIYSDVTGREINIAKSIQTGCLGSAMHAAVAAGFYKDIKEAAKYMAHLKDKKFIPNKNNVSIYNRLYKQYSRLHDYFGIPKNSEMKILTEIKKEVKSKS